MVPPLKRIAVLAITAVLAAAAVACGGGPAASGRSKDSLVVVQQAAVQSLNNNIASQRSSSRITGEIMEAAVRITYRGATPVLEPGLAESWQQVDAKTWRFKVRPGVKFSNGEPLTAEAFAKSLDYYRQDPAGKVTIVLANLSIKAVDQMTFEVHTSTPDLGSLPAQLTWMLVFPPAYRGGMTDAQFGNAPIGTGPYKLATWQKGVAIDLEANPDYWGQKPVVKRITIKSVPDAATRVGMIETGAADVVADVTPELAPRVQGIKDVKLEFAKSDSRAFLVLKTNQPPTDDLRVRQAINYAIDRKAIITTLFKGYADPLTGLFVEGESGFDPNFAGYSYDPAKAKALLAEAGKTGIAIDLNYTIGTSVLDKEVAEALQGQLQAVGFKVNMKGGPFATLQPKWRDPAKSSGIYAMTFSPVYGDSSFLLNRAYFHPESVYGVWGTDKELTGLADQAVAKTDPAVRQQLYAQAQDRAIAQEAMWAPILVLKQGYALRADLDWNPPADSRFYFETAKFR
ncbi:ABC transporter substrate-binding protein [Amycolatopsis jejuensis]|uniref:ABC transporter substrate-binding protein n=1 Tax=Amycolatopsis jejuensis TaxID=330084 RepID=UPI0012E03231|nr:ABC transporter substrate-binding protein [Amycolatopsis jejuensis]